MRIAALYDIHGNLPALEAVLRDVRDARVDQIVMGGDVFPGPMSGESLDSLLEVDVPVRCIHGNGDREVLAQKRGSGNTALPEMVREILRWEAARLTPQHEVLVAAWPMTLRLEVPELGDVLFCHATPDSDTALFTRRTPEARLRSLLGDLDVSLVICGHTHMQFDGTVGSVRIVNAGSVGMPFAEPGAYWLLLGPDVILRRTTYDLAGAADRIAATSYPNARDFAERYVVHPPSEQAMLEAYAKADAP
jgi:putative phosphoesterase